MSKMWNSYLFLLLLIAAAIPSTSFSIADHLAPICPADAIPASSSTIADHLPPTCPASGPDAIPASSSAIPDHLAPTSGPDAIPASSSAIPDHLAPISGPDAIPASSSAIANHLAPTSGPDAIPASSSAIADHLTPICPASGHDAFSQIWPASTSEFARDDDENSEDDSGALNEDGENSAALEEDGEGASSEFILLPHGGGAVRRGLEKLSEDKWYAPNNPRRDICFSICARRPWNDPMQTDEDALDKRPYLTCGCIVRGERRVVREYPPLELNRNGTQLIPLLTRGYGSEECLPDYLSLSYCLMYLNTTSPPPPTHECCEHFRLLVARVTSSKCLCYIVLRSELFGHFVNLSRLHEVVYFCAYDQNGDHKPDALDGVRRASSALYFCSDWGPLKHLLIETVGTNSTNTSLDVMNPCQESWRRALYACREYLKGLKKNPSKDCCKASETAETSEALDGPCRDTVFNRTRCNEGGFGFASCFLEAYKLCSLSSEVCREGEGDTILGAILTISCTLLVGFRLASVWVKAVFLVLLFGCCTFMGSVTLFFVRRYGKGMGYNDVLLLVENFKLKDIFERFQNLQVYKVLLVTLGGYFCVSNLGLLVSFLQRLLRLLGCTGSLSDSWSTSP